MKERLDEFKLKLADLIDEYHVEITADDIYPGYPECGQDIQICISIGSDIVDGLFIPSAECSFGTYIDSDKLRNG